MTIFGIDQETYQGLPIVEDWIRAAQSGDSEAALSILKDFVEAVDQNSDRDGRPLRTPSGIATQIDERVVRYFHECFKRIIDGEPPAVALNLASKGKRGRKVSGSTKGDSLVRGLKVLKAYRMQTGKKDVPPADGRVMRADIASAIGVVAAATHKAETTIRRDYLAWRRQLLALA